MGSNPASLSKDVQVTKVVFRAGTAMPAGECAAQHGAAGGAHGAGAAGGHGHAGGAGPAGRNCRPPPVSLGFGVLLDSHTAVQEQSNTYKWCIVWGHGRAGGAGPAGRCCRPAPVSVRASLNPSKPPPGPSLLPRPECQDAFPLPRRSLDSGHSDLAGACVALSHRWPAPAQGWGDSTPRPYSPAQAGTQRFSAGRACAATYDCPSGL